MEVKFGLVLSLVSMACFTFGTVEAGEVLLFEELFEDADWETRGWYDGPHMEITSEEHIEGSGHSCVWHWEEGDVGAREGGGRVRLPPVDEVMLKFHMKHSENWAWTGVNWHPHEFHFITNADHEYVGPAYTHLTFYVEVVNGVPRIAIQDGRNVDEGRIGVDLVDSTEKRAVGGCNGDADGHGVGDCYQAGDVHRNGKFWQPEKVYFGEVAGARYKGDWHSVEVRLRLNSLADGKAAKDGVLQYWFDGELIMDYGDVVFRTGTHPDMKINQFLMAPYFGPGAPRAQRIWIDDLRIFTDDGRSSAVESDNWGSIKRKIKKGSE